MYSKSKVDIDTEGGGWVFSLYWRKKKLVDLIFIIYNSFFTIAKENTSCVKMKR